MSRNFMLVDGAPRAAAATLAGDQDIVAVAYAQLTPAALKDHLPHCIILPLFGDGFDALDALARLAQLGFVGPVIVTGPAMPNPALVTRELAAAAPGMTVRLIDTTRQTGVSRL